MRRLKHLRARFDERAVDGTAEVHMHGVGGHMAGPILRYLQYCTLDLKH